MVELAEPRSSVAAFDLDLLAVRLEACASCAPISKAAVDVWQCNALGIVKPV
jgi:hypothetical protein